ncbi:hypothetical protein SLEP1_g21138 [Rubroshorea leprosula]|uniref:Fungal lipase-type domain-containing protein n=1 Tax=Rubroshorea leprosula TaxID=152421 RepID=A0AAV5JB31_9ROSI|nr:hypothetical protein SLEP1_g21138 [Rubroshorea leprosula]
MATPSTDCGYLIVCPERADYGTCSSRATVKPDHRWVIVVSFIALKIIHLISKPMQYTGYAVTFILNLISQNGGFFGLLRNLLAGNLVVPQRGIEAYISIVGQIDGRVDLYHGKKLVKKLYSSASGEISNNRELMDLCMMASKLSYENAEVVRNVVVHHWKMHFVALYNCWDDFQKEESTQVFILCDKPKDASLILISFRGTEPFNADDWSTDFDYSWYEIPGLGRIHMGFLEALGLGTRNDTSTFQDHLQVKSKIIPPEMVKRTAYYRVRRKLKSLLGEHKDAKFIVTGHSLGGALAILFPTVLVLHEEMGLMQRLLGVYTFGQPRIGDKQLGEYMQAHLDNPVRRYFRVVYCNDLVPRLPYDDKTFSYKHFGVCLYYDSCYNEHIMHEEPNKNYAITDAIPIHLNAVWELIRGLIMRYTCGPEYKEGWLAIGVRIIGLVLPGIAAHCPVDYINSIRLGKSSAIPKSSF